MSYEPNEKKLYIKHIYDYSIKERNLLLNGEQIDEIDEIDDIDDYFLHLQFIKMKKQNTEILLLKLVDYVKDIFLMIGNFLYPSKTNEIMQSAIYTMPQKYFSKYKSPI